jgi:carbon-monoxide dehydrogenase medium subunit
MTPAKFEYHRPGSVGEAVALLGRYGEEARLLAGGHSLIPLMKLRLATPGHLIDLSGVAALGGIGEADGTVQIGATAELIADPQVRNCGTLGGNVANGDPGNDMPAVMMCLGAKGFG